MALAEEGKLAEARALLDLLCSRHFDRASCFNNRAQLRKLQEDVDGQKADLDKAIDLAHAFLEAAKGKSEEEAPLSLLTFQRDVLKQAYTQRAIYNQ